MHLLMTSSAKSNKILQFFPTLPFIGFVMQVKIFKNFLTNEAATFKSLASVKSFLQLNPMLRS